MSEAAFQERIQRVQDAIALKEPDRIPCFPMTETFPYLNAGYTMAEVLYDTEKAKAALRKYITDFEPDLAPSYRAAYCGLGPFMEKMGIKWLQWAGGPNSIVHENGIHQFVEKEYLEEDEYPELLSDLTGWVMRKWLPRSFHTLEPLANVDFSTMLGFGYAPGTIQFKDPAVQQAMNTLNEAGAAYAAWSAEVSAFEQEIAAMGFPVQNKATVTTAFDLLSDTLRGTMGIFADLYDQPELVAKAVERLYPKTVNSALRQAAHSNGNLIFIPLHKGMDGFMSDDHYRTFYWDTLLRLVNALVDHNLTPFIYTEGPYDTRVECLMDVPRGKTIIHFEQADLIRAKKLLGNTACLCGGVNSHVLVNGTPADVADAVKRNLDILAPGGGCVFDISDTLAECKRENVETMFQTAREYGKY